jgi:hypothetical protein
LRLYVVARENNYRKREQRRIYIFPSSFPYLLNARPKNQL